MIEAKTIYVMGQNNPIAIVSKNKESGLTETKSGLAIFSGSDILSFIDRKYIGECMSISLSKNGLNIILCLGKAAFEILETEGNWIDFHFVGINEQGDRGMLSGECQVIDWNIPMSIDELNTEMSISCHAKNIKMKGFMGVTKQENEEIAYFLHKELLKTPGVY